MAGRRRTVAKAKPITSKQVKGYGYVPNPGVRTIVAVNGKGAYRRAHRSAREVMAPLSPPARRRRARTATRSERSARTGENTMRRNAKTRVRRALSGGRPAARRRATPRRRPMRRNAQPRSYAKGWEATFGKKTAKKSPARRKSPAKKKLTKAERAEISRRNLAKARTARKRGSSKTTRRSTTGRKKKLTKAERAAISRRNLAKARAARRKPKMAANRRRSTTRRKTTARKRPTTRRPTAAQRRASLKNVRKARSSQRRRPASSQRRMRKNARGSYRKNKSYRRNQGVMGLVKTAGYIAGGLMAHKALMGLADSFLVKPMFAPAPAAPAAVEGLPSSAQPLVSNLVSVALAAGGIYVTRQVVKNKADADAIVGGMAASAVHKALVSVISMVMPTAAGYLSGLDDSTAARLSAMYGLGASIQPYYAPISGVGEYFESGVAGMGEYFESGVAGMGEYFESGVNGPLGEYFESGVEGLGNYGQNPDLMQAAAGFGAMGESNTNLIDPTSDLDHQLTIAEAAAGVGSAYEAAAGYGELYEAAAGMGAIQDTPRASTWVPGQTNPQLWAGVRAIDRSQQATARVPAGVLASPGGGGIFG